GVVYNGVDVDAVAAAPDPAAARRELDQARPHLDASVLLRIPFVHVEVEWLRGLVALGCAEHATGAERAALLREARRHAATIDGHRMRAGEAWAAQLRAGVHRLEGDAERAATELRAAVDRLEATHTSLYACAARRRLGELLGGSQGQALIDRADADLRAREVVDPRRFSSMFAG
ncbi:MAG TPA: hypothetical protein VL172_22665, partial [Kofleriaceae bacterium]|nr:hypothetical protein [Kofleriaceae bacterium]